MKSNQKKTLLVVAVVTLTVLLLIFLLRPKEAVHQGRPLSYWVGQLAPHDFPPAMFIRPAEPELISWLSTTTPNVSWVEAVDRLGDDQTQARRGIRAIGIQAVPILLKKVRREDALPRRLYREIWRKVPIVRRFTSIAGPRDHARISAALAQLGQPAVALLVAALDDPSFHVRLVSLEALARMGTNAAAAVPRLIELLKGTNPAFHHHAIEALVNIGSASVPGLIELSRCANDQPVANSGAILGVKGLAHLGLSRIMVEARPRGPHLAVLMDGLERDSEARYSAAMALWQFHRDRAGMGVLASRLKTTTDAVESINIITVLGEMGHPAAPTIPAILEAVANQDRLKGFPVPMRSLTEIAREALAKINPDDEIARSEQAQLE